MPLIDKQYFVGNIDIPNTGKDYVEDSVNQAIKTHEPIFLEKALGYELFKAFINGLNPGNTTQDNPAQTCADSTTEATVTDGIDMRWIKLRDGAEYTSMSGTLTRWKGLLRPQQQSPISNYVFYWYVRENASQFTGIGEVATNSDNAVNVAPDRRMCIAWNTMVAMVIELAAFLDANVAIYPEWKNVSHWVTYKGVSYYYDFKFYHFTQINPLGI